MEKKMEGTMTGSGLRVRCKKGEWKGTWKVLPGLVAL